MQSVDEAYIVFLFFKDRLPVVIPFSLSVAVRWLFIQSVVVWIRTLCLLPFCLLPVAVHFLLSSWTLLFVFYFCKLFRSKCIKSLPSQFHQPTCCCFSSEVGNLSTQCLPGFCTSAPSPARRLIGSHEICSPEVDETTTIY